MNSFNDISSPVLQRTEVIYLNFFRGTKLDLDHFAPAFDKFTNLRELYFQTSERTCVMLTRGGRPISVPPDPMAWRALCGVEPGPDTDGDD